MLRVVIQGNPDQNGAKDVINATLLVTYNTESHLSIHVEQHHDLGLCENGRLSFQLGSTREKWKMFNAQKRQDW
jgi:hypothetical protein